MTLSRRAVLTGTAVLIVVAALPIPAPAAPAVPAPEVTVRELLMVERYDDLREVLEALPANGDYHPLVDGLRAMIHMSRSQLSRFNAID